MTNSDALAMIKAKIQEEDSDLRNVKAQAALSAAIGAFNRLGSYEWNRQYVEFSLTASDGVYLFTDIWPDYTVRRIEPKIWYVDETGWIDIVDYEYFNNETKYRSTTTGKPTIATVHSKEGTIEFYPVPDSAYTCQAMLYVLLNSINALPEEYHDLAVAYATMIAVDTNTPAGQAIYETNSRIWLNGLSDVVRHRKYTAWTGNQVGADPWITSAASRDYRIKPDADNLTGV